MAIQIPHSIGASPVISDSSLAKVKHGVVMVGVSPVATVDAVAMRHAVCSGAIRGLVWDDPGEDVVMAFQNLPRTAVTKGVAWKTRRALSQNMTDVLEVLRASARGLLINTVRKQSPSAQHSGREGDCR